MGGQPTGTVTLFTGPEKMRVESVQKYPVREMITDVVVPADNIPLGGLKVTPDEGLSANQFRSPLWPLFVSIAVQFQTPVLESNEQLGPPGRLKRLGLTESTGGVTVI